jgi:GNAT superfamily N-acetyltransferase
MAIHPAVLVASDAPATGTFEAMFQALDAESQPVLGPARPRLLVIPIHDDAGGVAGGFWGHTLFQWLHVQMLLVPATLRGRGIGSALMAFAEAEARRRGCRGALVDAYNFQAAPFYRRIGYTVFGELHDYPPGYDRLYFYKRFDRNDSGGNDDPASKQGWAPPKPARGRAPGPL